MVLRNATSLMRLMLLLCVLVVVSAMGTNELGFVRTGLRSACPSLPDRMHTRYRLVKLWFLNVWSKQGRYSHYCTPRQCQLSCHATIARSLFCWPSKASSAPSTCCRIWSSASAHGMPLRSRRVASRHVGVYVWC